MARGGRMRVRNESERRCILTREQLPKTGLVRFVVGPEDRVIPDIAGRLPGRGIWVSASMGLIAMAVKKGLFSRAAKRRVNVDPDLPAQVEDLMARQLISLVAMARKAGQAVAGREKTLAALVSGEAQILLQASDGSPRERDRLRAPGTKNSRVSCLTGVELGMAFGRDRVIHAAVLAGGLADRVGNEALRLSGIRVQNDRQPFEDGAGKGLAEEGLRGKG